MANGMREQDAFLCRNVKNMTNYALHIWGMATPKYRAPFLSYRCTAAPNAGLYRSFRDDPR